MKTEIPENLKADLPSTNWGKTLGLTPVVLAVLATLLAGLASSELTSAQYARALAAQLQSKAGDQWGLFQAKKLKSALQGDTIDQLASMFPLRPVDATSLPRTTAGEKAALALLEDEKAPEVAATALRDPGVKAAIDAVGNAAPESAIAPLVARLDISALEGALQSSSDDLRALDATMKPGNQAVALLEPVVDRLGAAGDVALNRNFTVLRLRHTMRRYDAEAALNQVIANLYELEVRKANLSADRHHFRSQRFFYGMLGAQMAVIIATLAIAARQRSLLWSLAAAAGLAAVAFALYVYLRV